MHFTYIIESKSTGKWYYGSSSNLEARLDGHNKGLNVSTRNRGPWRLIFSRGFEVKEEAVEFELHLKKTRNKQFIKRLYRDYFL